MPFRPVRLRAIAVIAMLLIVAFAALGARPLWDPDEGRYTNVALNMLSSGDFVHPMRSEEAGHWTKPPLTYWAIASSIATFGTTPWAARLPMALAFLATSVLCFRMARRIAPSREVWAALAFGTAFFPAMAAQTVTTDFLLTAFLSLAMWGYIEARFGEPETRSRWVMLFWLGLGLGFLTKGPPALLPLLAIAPFQWLSPPEQRPRLLVNAGMPIFLLLAFGWFAWVTWQRPELFRYFLGQEVVERIAGHGFGRNTGPLGWAKVYLPVMLLGTLPWTLALWRWVRGIAWRTRITRLRDWAADPGTAPDLLLSLWFALPLLVLCIASSRLPLYVLPLFAPLALMVARSPGAPLRHLVLLPLWVAALIGLRVYLAQHPTDADASAWARDIAARVDGPISEVVFVEDKPRYGLHLYLEAEIESVMLGDSDAVAKASDFDHSLWREVDENEPAIVYLVPEERWADTQAFLSTHGVIAQPFGEPMRGRIVFGVRRESKPLPAPTSHPSGDSP